MMGGVQTGLSRGSVWANALGRGDQTRLTEVLPLIVSVDDHIIEPPHLWVDRVPERLRDRVPHMVRERVQSHEHPNKIVWGDVWHYEDVRVPVERGYAAVGLKPEQVDYEPVIFDELRLGCYDTSARLLDMDQDGVEASICFPNVFVRFCGQRFLEARDREIAFRCVQVYNDWAIDEFAGSSDGRLLASAIIPLWDANLAAAEVRRNAERGCTSVCFSEIPARLGLPSMYSGYWEPFFAACAETRTVINLHIGSSSKVHTTSEDAPTGVRVSNHFGNSAFSLTDWIMCGAFERYPTLKVAFSEGQAGWIPYLMSRLDTLWAKGHPLLGFSELLPSLPSSYLAGHVYACVFDDPTAMRMLDYFADDALCFETDYPHPDGLWPNSRAIAWELTGNLSEPQRRRILRDNGAQLYRIERVLKNSKLRVGST